MAFVNKNLNKYKYGFSKFRKRQRVNSWRFFFSGLDEFAGTEQMFLLEFIMVNPWLSPSEVRLGADIDNVPVNSSDSDKKNVKIKLKNKELPSYCAVRICKLGKEPRNLCVYVPVKDVNFSSSPFSIDIDENFKFSESQLNGRISISERDGSYRPELLCDKGYAIWELTYEVEKGFAVGFNDDLKWFPSGLHTLISGKVLFDGVEYKIRKERSYGYSERFWGKTFPSPWFHLSSNELISEYSGKALPDSSFSVHGIFDGKITFVGHFGDLEIISNGDNIKHGRKINWDCVKLPETDKDKTNLIHWSCTFPVKSLVVDIDVYCRLNELLHRFVKLPGNSGGVLKLLAGYSDWGEIKLYKRNGTNLEQIEHARLNRIVCEYGAEKKR